MLVDGGYRIVGRMAGRVTDAPDILWQLSFFAADLWLLLLAVPLILALLCRVAGERITGGTVYVLALAAIVLAFVNLNALGSTGKFLTWDQIAPMLVWAREKPAAILDYVSASAMIKFAVIVSTVLALYRYRHAPLFTRFDAAFPLALVFAVMTSAVAGYAVLADASPRSRYHAPVASRMVGAMFASDGVAAADTRVERIDYVCERDRLFDGKRLAPRDKPNVVLFLMETVPYELYVYGKKKGLPHMAALERSALVAHQHYTTYPFTSYARFSILTGLYPPYRLEKTVRVDHARPYRSAFSSFASEGYDFTLFDPITHRYPVDDWIVHQLGGRVVSTAVRGDDLAKDKALLGELIGRIGTSARASTPFLYAYLPQLTHGPWLAPGASKEVLYEEGYRRLKHVDDRLGELVAALDRHGVRDNTIIVLTADHGLRTRQEAGFLKTAVLNDTSYHVPLVIHDPRFARSIPLSQPTSHVDISPSLHCAYGAAGRRIDTQGAEVVSTKPARRSIRFGGEWYHGSGGVWADGHFYSYNAQLDMLWKSSTFDFDEGKALPNGGAEAGVVSSLVQANQMQEKLVTGQFDVMTAQAEARERVR